MGLKAGVIGLAVLLAGCAERAEPAVEAPQMNAVERNRMYLAQEREMLKDYIDTHEFIGIVRDGYGMYSLSMLPGTGMIAEMGDEVIYQATVYLLDDSGVGQYTDTVELGYSQIDIGLHEAISGMKEGEKKLVLIPSFLARGLAGDLDKVPPQSPLRYDLRLIQVNR